MVLQGKKIKKAFQPKIQETELADSDSSDSSSDEEDLKAELKEAQEIVAKALPADAEGKQREAQLQRLKKEIVARAGSGKTPIANLKEAPPAKAEEQHETKVHQQKENASMRISDLIKNMEVKAHKPSSSSRQFKDMSGDERKGGFRKRGGGGGGLRNMQGRSPMNTKHLYDGAALGIFTKDGAPLDNLHHSAPSFFDVLEDEMYAKQQEFPPMTAYQEVMEWTKQNKTWQFPIDNERGMDEEAGVGFHEHVFLSHLILDFPKGPIRHYMELVATGLSKNPYMTVQEKHGHIEWYRQYFADKSKLVDELIDTEMAAQQ